MLNERKTSGFFSNPVYKSRLEQYLKEGDCMPLDVVIHLNSYCQQKCDFCYNSLNLGNKYPPISNFKIEGDDAIRLIDELSMLGVQNILLSGGGEPLLHPQRKHIIQSLLKNNLTKSLYTNLDVDISDIMNMLPNLDSINVNINTADPTLYKKTRGGHANIPRVKDNIIRLAHRGACVNATMIVRDNTVDSLESSVNELLTLGVSAIVVSPAFSMRYSDSIYLTEQSIQRLEHLKIILSAPNVRIVEPEHTAVKNDGKVFCKSHYFDVTIGADYSVYPCCATAYLDGYKIFSLKDYKDFKEGWKSDERKLWSQRNALACETCWFEPVNYTILNLEKK